MKRRLIVAAFASAAALVFMGGSASAQCRYGGGGYGGYGYGGSGLSIGYSSYAPRSAFSVGYSSFPSYGYSSSFRGGYRSRGHYDYHPPSLYRHGNHFHVQPGHYDYHRGSHRRGHGRW